MCRPRSLAPPPSRLSTQPGRPGRSAAAITPSPRPTPPPGLGAQPLCRRFDLVPYSLYARYHAPKKRAGGKKRKQEKAVVRPRASNDGIGAFRLRSERAVQQAFGELRHVHLIELRGWWRSVTNNEAERKTLRYQGVTMRPSAWELNPGYEQIAAALIGGAMAPRARGRYLAVQWRTEDWQAQMRKRRGGRAENASHPRAMVQCARWAAERVAETMAAHGLTEVILATDLRKGSSGTYAHGAAQEAALATLEEAVPALRATRLRGLIDGIADSGVRASVETALCTQATMMLTTTSNCRNCRRAARCSKLSSAFGKYILHRREAYRRPTEPLF